MKYCQKCQREVDAENDKCPFCDGALEERLSDEESAEIVATSTLLL